MSNKSLINQKIFCFSKYLQNSDLFKQIKTIAQNKSLQLSIIEIYFKHKSSNTQRHNSFLQTHILIHLKNDFSRFVTLNGSIGITKIIKKKTNKVDQQQNYTYFTLIDLPPTDKPSLKILRSLDFLTLLSQNKRWETRKFNEIAVNDYRTTRSAFLSYLSNQTFNDLGVKIIQLSKTLSYPGYGWKRMRIEKNQNQFKTIKVGHLKKQSPHKRQDKKNKKTKTKSYSNPNLSGKKVSVSSKQKSENDKQKDKNNRKQKKKINKKESPESSESEELSQGSESEELTVTEELPETEESEEKNLKEKSKKKENQKRKEKPKKKEQNEKKQSEKDKKKKNKNINKNKKDLPNKKEIVRINLFQNKQELVPNPMLEINEFIKNFKENPPKNVETKKILIDFVNNITKSIMDSKQIKNIDCDKQLLFCKIFDYIYELILQEIHFQIITIIKERYNVDIDRQFRSTISNMNYIQLKHFQINKKYIDIKKLAMSSVWLEKINQVILPSKKLFIINSCVNYLLSSFKKKSDLENKKLFLLLSYIILHSKISNIKSNVKYIQIYQLSEQFEDTQTEINFKLFKLAIQFLENLKGEKLKNNQKPWRKYILKLKNIVIVQKKDVSENEKVQEIERENEGGEGEEEENGEDIDEKNVILNSPQNSNNNDKKKTQKSENSLEISKETENLNIITNKKKTQNSLHLKKSESVPNDTKQIQNKMNQNNKNEENDLISFEKDKDDGYDKEQIEINHKKEKKENKENENENKNKNEKDENKESFQKNGNDEKELASFVKDDNNHKVQENNDKKNNFNKNNENNQMKKKKMKIKLEEISKQSEFGKFLKQDFQKLSLPEVYEFIEEYNKLYSEFIHLEKSVNLEKK
ncbi:heat shock transcription factor [Anaeramoeba flamelloides]|uniref:Heat shock transcription factor n=1 Tax=Anaeramoeba flamelloides TaxID=1746091 RepID=A0AAV8A110_9EUKA|nr:heat shock transcription factor [Anaeramoeba flamelloides]